MTRTRNVFSWLILAIFVASVMPVVACKKSDDDSSESDGKKKKKAADDEDEDEDQPKSKKKKKKAADDEDEDEAPKKKKKKASADDGSDEKIGVEECDQYVTLYEKCLKKMSSAAAEAAQEGLKSMRKAWSDTAKSGSAAKEGLRTGCKQALKQAKTSMGPQCKGVYDDVD